MAKKKLKKLMKVLGAGAAIAGLGKAFMNNRARNAMISGADANDGFRAPFKRPNMLDIAGGIPDRGRGNIQTRPRMMTPQDMANDPMFLDAMAKDGGKIVKTEKGGKAVRRKKKKSIQIKGFGKARR
jgi:hypothetical protein